MVVICLGPVCIPLWPIIALAAKPFWDKLVPITVKRYIAKTWAQCCKRKKKEVKHEVLDKIQIFTCEQEFNDRLRKKNPFLVKFTAQWCGPCQQISPFLNTLSVEHRGKLDFFQVDIDQLDDLALSLGVISIPAFHIYKKGSKVAELVGANQQKLVAMIEKIDIVDYTT